jgi:hypothetical protein
MQNDPLIIVLDDDTRVGAYVLSPNRTFEERPYPYFQLLARLFEVTRLESVNGFSCGDCPVSTPLLLRCELSDLEHFLKLARRRTPSERFNRGNAAGRSDCASYFYYGLSTESGEPLVIPARRGDRRTYREMFLRYADDLPRLEKGGNVSRVATLTLSSLWTVLRPKVTWDPKAPSFNRCYRLSSDYFQTPHLILDRFRRNDLLPMLLARTIDPSVVERWSSVTLPVIHERGELRHWTPDSPEDGIDLLPEARAEFLGAELYHLFEIRAVGDKQQTTSLEEFRAYRRQLWSLYADMFDAVRRACVRILILLDDETAFWSARTDCIAARDSIARVVSRVGTACAGDKVEQLAAALDFDDGSTFYGQMSALVDRSEQLSRTWEQLCQGWFSRIAPHLDGTQAPEPTSRVVTRS